MVITTGATVKYSTYALERDRQNSMGGFSERSRMSAKREYERRKAMRGTVTEQTQEHAFRVEWSDGTKSETIDYMLETAKDGE